MLWNPFTHLIGSKKYPFSRIVHASFFKRIKDTFEVFFGGKATFPQYNNEKLGLIDYVFPFPFLFQKAWEASSNIVFIVILAIPYFALQAIKVIAAAVLTLLSSPFVLFVHLCTKPKSNQYEERVMKLKALIPSEKQNEFKEETIEDVLKITPELKVNLFADGLEKTIETLLTPKLTVSRLGRDLDEHGYEQTSGQIYLYIARALGPNTASGDHVVKVAMTSENYKGLSALYKGNFFKVENCTPEYTKPTVDDEVSKLNPKRIV